MDQRATASTHAAKAFQALVKPMGIWITSREIRNADAHSVAR